MWKIYTKAESEPLENRIANFMKKYGINLSSNTDVVELCQKFDILTFKMPLEKFKLDGLILVENNEKRIAVNESLDFEKARFTICHELGHYITECEENEGSDKQMFFAAKDKIFHHGYKPDSEHDMDYMAAALLVPKNQFLEELKSFNYDLSKVKGVDEKDLIANTDKKLVNYFADRYKVEPEVVLKRIAEVAYYV